MSRRVLPLAVALVLGLALAAGIGFMLLSETRVVRSPVRGAVAKKRPAAAKPIVLDETVSAKVGSSPTAGEDRPVVQTESDGAAPEKARAVASAPEGVTATRRVSLGGADQPVPKSGEALPAERRAGLRGRFVDSKGQPIPGLTAKVTPQGLTGAGPRLFFAGRFRSGGESPAGTKTITADDQGRWSVDGLDADFRWALASEATEEFLATRHRIPTPRAGATVDCGDQKVARPGSISGLVLDPSGRPVPGARVRIASGSGDFPIHFGEPGDDEEDSGRAGGMGAIMVTADGDSGEALVFGEQWEKTRTDASGRFAFKGLKPGPWTAFGEKKGFRRGRLGGIRVEENRETRDLRLTLAEPGRVVVTVRDPEGRPLAGAGAELTPGGAGMVIFTEEPKTKPKRRTDGNGEIAFEGLGAESYSLVVEAEGFARARRAVTLPADQAELRMTVEMTPGVTVALRVVKDLDGAPVPGAQVMLTRFEKGPKGRVWLPPGDRTPVDEQGVWRRGGYAPGRVQLAVTAPGFQEFRKSVTIPGDGPVADLGEIRLLASGRIEVTVLDAEGRPVEGAQVSAGGESAGIVVRRASSTEGDEGKTSEEVEVSASFSTGAPSGGARTDAAGRVVVRDVQGESVTVKASKAGQPDVYVADVAVPSDGRPGQVTLSFSAPGRIHGRAFGKNGEVLAKTPVMLFVPGWPMAVRSGRTDTEGQFAFEGLGAGEYQLVMTEVSFHAGSKARRLRLEPGAELQHDLHKASR